MAQPPRRDDVVWIVVGVLVRVGLLGIAGLALIAVWARRRGEEAGPCWRPSRS